MLYAFVVTSIAVGSTMSHADNSSAVQSPPPDVLACKEVSWTKNCVEQSTDQKAGDSRQRSTIPPGTAPTINGQPVLSPGWKDTRTIPQIHFPASLGKTPPGEWKKRDLRNLATAVTKQEQVYQDRKGLKDRVLSGQLPRIDPNQVTVLAFFSRLGASDHAGLCEIVSGMKDHPLLVKAYVYLELTQGSQRASAAPAVTPSDSCLKGVGVHFDLGGTLLGQLSPEGLPAAMFIYGGRKQWVRLSDSGLALKQLYLRLGVN